MRWIVSSLHVRTLVYNRKFPGRPEAKQSAPERAEFLRLIYLANSLAKSSSNTISTCPRHTWEPMLHESVPGIRRQSQVVNNLPDEVG